MMRMIKRRSITSVAFWLLSFLCLFIIVKYEKQSSMYDRNLYSVFDNVLPLNLRVMKFQGKYGIRDSKGRFPIMLSEAYFPINNYINNEYDKIYISKIKLISRSNKTLQIIAKSSKSGYYLMSITSYRSESILGDYSITFLNDLPLDSDNWCDLEKPPNYLKMWQIYAIAFSILFVILISLAILSTARQLNSINFPCKVR
ncbi:MAG: hypothetical protein ACJASR_002503 [Psychroserpens sp.]|jgi:hypothetical protein